MIPLHSAKNKGYITLLSTLIVGAVGVAIATSLILAGLGSSRASFAIEQSNQSKALANACSEEALQQIRNSTSFQGMGSLLLGQGNCTYNVIKLSEQNREIRLTGTVGSVIRKVKITIDTINPQINIVSWQEVDNF